MDAIDRRTWLDKVRTAKRHSNNKSKTAPSHSK
jgi:hypothetical protein